MSALPFPITLDDMIAEVNLELSYRERGWSHRMQDASLALQNALQRRIEIMRALKARLEAERDREGLGGR